MAEDTHRAIVFFARMNGDNKLGNLARMDQAEPDTADARLELAKGWWDIADTMPSELKKRSLQARAVHWYEEAIPGLTGLAARAVEQRLEKWEVQQRHRWMEAASQDEEAPMPGGGNERDLQALDADSRRIGQKLRLGDFQLVDDRRWTYTAANVQVLNESGVGQIENKITARIRLLCVNSDDVAGVIEYESPIEIAEHGQQQIDFSGPSNDHIEFQNAGNYVPVNAHLLVEFEQVPIYEALWRPDHSSASFRRDEEMPWWEDADLIVD